MRNHYSSPPPLMPCFRLPQYNFQESPLIDSTPQSSLCLCLSKFTNNFLFVDISAGDGFINFPKRNLISEIHPLNHFNNHFLFATFEHEKWNINFSDSFSRMLLPSYIYIFNFMLNFLKFIFAEHLLQKICTYNTLG